MAGLSLSLLLVAGLLAWAVLDDEPYVAPTPGPTPREASPALASRALQALEEAVRRHDVAAARALAPDGDRAAAAQLTALVANGRATRVSDFSLRYVAELGAVSPDGGWAAGVDATWAFAGFDDAPARSEVRFRFLLQDGEAAIAGVGGGDRRTPVWMSGPVEVRRTVSTLVIVDGGDRAADAFARRARTAVPVVRRVLHDWHGGLVVEVPGSARDLQHALDSNPGEYAQIAAVTTTVDGSLAPDAPVHVFVNPQVFSDLKPRGAQVVMTHEAVHVATGAATSTMPLWLLEGFGDYVALRDVPLPVSVTASQVIRQVRRHGPPPHLPGPDEFDTTRSHLGASYEAAWLACRLLADLGGQQKLVELYRRVDAGAEPDTALRAVFGLTERQFTRSWQDLLTDLAA